jgi:integrase
MSALPAKAALVHPPRVAQAEIEIIREDEIKVVLDVLRGRNPPLYTIAMVALATGMRRGELLALRWKDIELDASKLRVEQSLEQTRAGLRFKAPKTKHGRRTITIPPAVVADLRAHWKASQEQRLALGLGRSEVEAMFARTAGRSKNKPAVFRWQPGGNLYFQPATAIANYLIVARRRGGRVAEGGGLLNRYTV